MQTEQKKQIAQSLREYCARYESQNKAANSLTGVSAATISQMLNEKWDLIKDEMWRNVASQIGHTSKDWSCVETTDFKLITQCLSDAQEHSNVFAIIGDAGSGKSKSLELYTKNHKNAYLLSCSEYWNRKEFLSQLLLCMGIDYSGYTVSEMMNEVVRRLKSQKTPVIAMDEFDKLADAVFYFFISIYNQLEEHCGIVICATDHLKKRIEKGLRLNKKGYKEIYSRIGRKFIELKGVTSTDITQICIANGVEDKAEIRSIYLESEGDLRRVKRRIHAYKNKK